MPRKKGFTITSIELKDARATNTILLGNKIGGKKDYEEYLKIQADSTTTCLELKDAWRDYNSAIDKLR